MAYFLEKWRGSPQPVEKLQSLPQAELFVRQRERPGLRSPAVAWPPRRSAGLFHCDKPSGVPRGPTNSTASLTSQSHPGKFPKVPGRSRGDSYFGHLIQRADSLEKTLMLGKIEGRMRRGRQKMRWLNAITNSMDVRIGL